MFWSLFQCNKLKTAKVIVLRYFIWVWILTSCYFNILFALFLAFLNFKSSLWSHIFFSFDSHQLYHSVTYLDLVWWVFLHMEDILQLSSEKSIFMKFLVDVVMACSPIEMNIHWIILNARLIQANEIDQIYWYHLQIKNYPRHFKYLYTNYM